MRIFSAVAFLLTSAAAAFAQVEDKQYLEEQRRQEQEELERKRILDEEYKQDFLWDFGGWLRAEFIHFDDPPNRDTRTIRFYDLRLWGAATLWRRYHAYVRILNQITDFNSGDQFKGRDDDKFRFLRLDEAYVEADFSDAMSNPYDQFRLKLGRQYIRLGRGLVYNNVADGLKADLTTGPWSFELFGVHSNISDDDIDRSRPDAGHSYRLYIGAEIGWSGLGAHTLYLLGMVQRDLNDESPDNPVQDFDYNSNYVGVGARGQILKGLSYQAELVYEFGTSVAVGTTETESISAFALTAMLEYSPGWPTSPVFYLEYMFGSGDSDRGSPTDTQAGNAAGTTDNGFLPFGFIQTGFALFPRVSNIHILRIAGAFKPLESVEALKSLEIGVAFYWYRKDREEEAITDPRSFLFDKDIGTEIDAFLRWRIFSDLGFSINFGHFMPGKAYDETSDRDFISLGVTYTF